MSRQGASRMEGTSGPVQEKLFDFQIAVPRRPARIHERRTFSPQTKPSFLEFFAGSGLVAYALRPYFKVVWANDISAKKAAVYTSNHDPKHFRLGSIAYVRGSGLPP